MKSESQCKNPDGNPEHIAKVKKVLRKTAAILLGRVNVPSGGIRKAAPSDLFSASQGIDWLGVWEQEFPKADDQGWVAPLNLNGADLSGSCFVSVLESPLNRACFRNAKLERSIWITVQLIESDFTGASLRDCLMLSSVCTGSRFRDADLTGAYLDFTMGHDGADFTNANLSQAEIHKRPLDAFGTTAERHRIILAGANMTDCRICIDEKNARQVFMGQLSAEQQSQVIESTQPTDPSRVKCPHCSHPNVVAPCNLGIEIRCMKCGQSFSTSSPEDTGGGVADRRRFIHGGEGTASIPDVASLKEANLRSVKECQKDLVAKVKAAQKDHLAVGERSLRQAQASYVSRGKIREEMERALDEVVNRHIAGIDAVLFELAVHDSPEAVKAICKVISSGCAGVYRRLAMETLSKMSHPSAGKALSKRASSFVTLATPEEQEEARDFLRKWKQTKRNQEATGGHSAPTFDTQPSTGKRSRVPERAEKFEAACRQCGRASYTLLSTGKCPYCKSAETAASTDPTRVRCPHCSHMNTVAPSNLGMEIRCMKCGESFETSPPE